MSGNFGKIILWNMNIFTNFFINISSNLQKKSQLKEYTCKSQNKPQIKLLQIISLQRQPWTPLDIEEDSARRLLLAHYILAHYILEDFREDFREDLP